MIGYYVHHVGRGHLHRAAALAASLDVPVTGLSSLPRPDGWAGDWIELDRDDATGGADPTANGWLHWVPEGDPGLLSRMADISAWCAKARPALLVSDVSVEVALLARLHGVPVLSVVLPGDRRDRAHQLGFAASHALVSFWPESADGMVLGLDDDVRRRWHRVGALSRYPAGPKTAAGRRVVVLSGSGGDGFDRDLIDAARAETPAWDWQVLGPGSWVDDPFPVLLGADVVVTHAGQNALAEVAASRTPAIVVPGGRPHDEQRTTASVLASGPWPVEVEQAFPTSGWAERLAAVAAQDGSAWQSWCDGRAAGRFAGVVDAVLREVGR